MRSKFGSATQNMLPADNFTTYDKAAREAVPVFIVGWLKNTTKSEEPWGDAKLVCMTPGKNFSEGSRQVEASAGAKLMKLEGAMYWVVLVTALVGLI